MTSYYDEVEIEDFEWDEDTETFYYPCPCGDRFQITKEELIEGEDVATCPSCSLLLKVIYDPEQFQEESTEEQIIITNAQRKLIAAVNEEKRAE
ncbi:unnamed protein product [Orchesella dallaii]|uniref:Diphthamide biosynthesis protein 3 n=1 Tax=Orchesella dallaii TaxID=48710 RepID=A0ABP1PUE0_9HEXA